MREISPHLQHQPGHDRAPGPKPVPVRRRSTQPQEVSSVSPSSPAASPPVTPVPAAKPRKGQGCGSKKPRYALTKALIRMALLEGHFEMLEEREERLAEQQAAKDASPNATADSGQVQESDEPLHIVTVITGDDGQEKMQYHSVGQQADATTEIKPAKSLEEILAEQKVRRLLANMKEVKVVINVGALVQAAKQDPKLYKMLQETRVPSKTSAPPKAKTDRKVSATRSTRPSMGTSHSSAYRSRSKGKPTIRSVTPSKAGGKKKFH